MNTVEMTLADKTKVIPNSEAISLMVNFVDQFPKKFRDDFQEIVINHLVNNIIRTVQKKTQESGATVNILFEFGRLVLLAIEMRKAASFTGNYDPDDPKTNSVLHEVRTTLYNMSQRFGQDGLALSLKPNPVKPSSTA